MCIHRAAKRFLANKSASILPTFGLMILPIMITIGAAVDYTMASKHRGKMANMADAAILAAAVEVKKLGDLSDTTKVEAALKEEMTDFLKANMGDYQEPLYEIGDVKYDPKTKGIELVVDYSHPTSFMKIVGVDELEGSVETAVFIHLEEKQSLSMALVLDRSGSMNWTGQWVQQNGKWVYIPGEHRMTALKKAVSVLVQQFESQDPEHKYVRTGAVAYNSSVQGKQKMNWGTAHVNNFTQSLQPGGGTNSSGAMKVAFNYLKGNKEEKQHAKKNKGEPKKYILFMTDGANNHSSYDTKTLKQCNKAKKQDIIVYSVAFQAPTQGQKLLKSCATSEGHYYNADNSTELIAIFKNIGEQAAQQLAIAK